MNQLTRMESSMDYGLNGMRVVKKESKGTTGMENIRVYGHLGIHQVLRLPLTAGYRKETMLLRMKNTIRQFHSI